MDPGTASPSAEPSPANALVMYSQNKPPMQLLDLPLDLLKMICDRVTTGREQLAFTQTCRQLRMVMCFATQMEVPEMVLLSFRAEGMQETKLRRMFTYWIHTIADQDPFLAVCGWCLTIHDLGIGRESYTLPAVVQRVRKELFQISTKSRRECDWALVEYARESEMASTYHMNIQLAFKYRRMQMEDPEAFEALTPENKRRLGVALLPKCQYRSTPMSLWPGRAQVNCIQYTDITTDEDGEQRFVVKTDVAVTSTKYKRVQVPGEFQQWSYEPIPFTSVDIMAFRLCHHQVVRPRHPNDDSSADMNAELEDESYERVTNRSGNLFRALKRKWHRIKNRALDLFTHPEPGSENVHTPSNQVSLSDYANVITHRALARRGLRQLGVCCPLCKSDFLIGVSNDGTQIWITTWRDFGSYASPASHGWLQHVDVHNFFYNVTDFSLEGVTNRGSEAIMSPHRQQDFSVLHLYEGTTNSERASPLKTPSTIRRLICMRSRKKMTITRSYDDNLIKTDGVAVEDNEGED